ncbi:RING-H2 finger protein ATL34-like [Selaginella moellendorffii]|uniref:RING-H2 finger protein ATL34-like n=1 Tax=Selaginella moellendorffii TaxID=88036 RepID=UPI000D1CE873|nr:RING-H2 finger protein ATL34-like [Selaginella moellendorffii]|eukprot:XP_024532799.1 RING-H2 finger protein ATL34-like [Selaginella moellendorffii]
MQDPRSSSPLSSSLATDRLTVVIVCSILFAFMLLSLLIFFYACKCVEARNRRHRQVQEEGQELVGAGGGGFQSRLGLSKDLVKRLPVVSYEQLVKIKSGEENVECCAVCLIEFGKGDSEIRHLPRCGHCFHTDCIDMWFFSHSSCPICRDSLQKEPLLEVVST